MVSLLLFETGYRTASFLLVMHAVSAAVDYSLKAQNFSYLTAENYLKFLASPLSVVLLLGILILILLLFLIEISALLSCFRHSYQGRKIYTSDMLIEGVKRSWDFLKNSHVSWFWCIILAAPFLSIYFLIREISYIRVLEFTARQIYKIVSPHWILYGLIGIILLFSFLFIFSLPYCLLEEQKSRKGMKDGLKLLKRDASGICPASYWNAGVYCPGLCVGAGRHDGHRHADKIRFFGSQLSAHIQQLDRHGAWNLCRCGAVDLQPGICVRGICQISCAAPDRGCHGSHYP